MRLTRRDMLRAAGGAALLGLKGDSRGSWASPRTAGKFGKRPARRGSKPALRFGDYVEGGAIAVRPATANLARVYGHLGVSDPAVLFPMDGNDTYQDCAISALAHSATLWAGYTGRYNVPSADACEQLYFQLTGGSDSGLWLSDVLTYVGQNVFLDEPPILGCVSVDPATQLQVQQAMGLFGPLYAGCYVTDAMIAQFLTGLPWDGSGEWVIGEGHCIPIVDYNSMTGLLTCLSWGAVQMATWPFFGMVDELYAIVPGEAAAANYQPGFNMPQLLADLGSV